MPEFMCVHKFATGKDNTIYNGTVDWRNKSECGWSDQIEIGGQLPTAPADHEENTAFLAFLPCASPRI